MNVRELIAKLQEFDPELPVTTLDQMEDDVVLTPDAIEVDDDLYYERPGQPGDSYRQIDGPHVRIG